MVHKKKNAIIDLIYKFIYRGNLKKLNMVQKFISVIQANI